MTKNFINRTLPIGFALSLSIGCTSSKESASQSEAALETQPAKPSFQTASAAWAELTKHLGAHRPVRALVIVPTQEEGRERRDPWVVYGDNSGRFTVDAPMMRRWFWSGSKLTFAISPSQNLSEVPQGPVQPFIGLVSSGLQDAQVSYESPPDKHPSKFWVKLSSSKLPFGGPLYIALNAHAEPVEIASYAKQLPIRIPIVAWQWNGQLPPDVFQPTIAKKPHEANNWWKSIDRGVSCVH